MKEVCYRASRRLSLVTVLVANQRLSIPAAYQLVSTVRVDGGSDVADAYIAEHATAGWARDKQAFANALDRVLARVARQARRN